MSLARRKKRQASAMLRSVARCFRAAERHREHTATCAEFVSMALQNLARCRVLLEEARRLMEAA